MQLISEELIQFVWNRQLFSHENLHTTYGEPIQILDKGELNYHQGPDFLNAKIKIGSTVMVGQVEIHVKNEAWYEHKHQFDANYDNVILHVVYYNTSEIFTQLSNSQTVPILCLQDLMDTQWLQQAQALLNNSNEFACQNLYQPIDEIFISSFKESLFHERIIRKSAWIQNLIISENYDYETAFYIAFLSGFGLYINKSSFEAIGKSLPQKYLSKHIQDIVTLEALLMGQANLLNHDNDYARELHQTYDYYKNLYGLKPINEKILFARLRPANFPTLRLAQFASFIHNQSNLYDKLTEFDSLSDIKPFFDIQVSDFWQTHYNFNASHEPKSKKLSNNLVNTLLINILFPFIYLLKIKNNQPTDEVINWYQFLSPEINSKTKKMSEFLKLNNFNAYDSQALIEWKSTYCQQKKCLKCVIGAKLLK